MSTNMNNSNGSAERTITIIRSDKSIVSAILFCIFLGGFGAHRFYVGKTGTGILMLLTCGGFGIWTLIDLINLACCNFTDAKGHYLEFVRQPTSPFLRVIRVLALIFIALLVYIGLLISLVLYATSGVTGAAREQLNALRAHDFAKAYSYTSAAFKRATSLQQFTEFVRAYPSLIENRDSTFNERSIDQNGTGTIRGTVEGADGSTTPIVYELIKENGEWKIQSIVINPGKAGISKNAESSNDDQNTDMSTPDNSQSDDSSSSSNNDNSDSSNSDSDSSNSDSDSSNSDNSDQ